MLNVHPFRRVVAVGLHHTRTVCAAGAAAASAASKEMETCEKRESGFYCFPARNDNARERAGAGVRATEATELVFVIVFFFTRFILVLVALR